MSTRVYGASDDLIEVEGDVRGEASGGEEPSMLILSDGTLLSVQYGKPGLGGVWGVSLIRKGELFDRIDQCTDENAEIYSDIAYFKDGLTKAWAAKEFDEVH